MEGELSAAPGSSRLAAFAPYLVFLLLAILSWNRWLEPYVDSGRELMVPWRVAQGEALYRDVHFHHGPLAAYLGAAVDRVAGRSLPARTGLAAAIALAHLAALWRVARRALPAGPAALASSLAVAAAMFLRPGGWLFPFSFDTAIAVAALTWALAWATPPAGRAPNDHAAAIALAVALLSRLELGVVGLVAVGLEARKDARRARWLLLPPLAAAGLGYGAVSVGVPWSRLIEDGWLRLLSPPEAFRNVYRAYAGLDRLGFRLAELGLAVMMLLVAGAFLAAAAFAASRSRSAGGSRLAGALGLGALLAAAALALRPPGALAEPFALFPPLVRVVPPVVLALAGLRLAARFWHRESRIPLAGVPDAVLIVAAVFSARLLLAAGYAGPYNAFFLPLPILVAVAGLDGLARRAAPSLGAALPRLVHGALGVFLLFRMAALGLAYRAPVWSAVPTPAGSVTLPEPVAATTREALADLERRLSPGGALAGFPEGGFFNYVLGAPSPFGLEQFFPGHLDESGERRVIAALEKRPPRAILLANVLAVGEDAPAFGKDYLRELAAAVEARFRPVAIYGPGAGPRAAIGDPGFFVAILEAANR